MNARPVMSRCLGLRTVNDPASIPYSQEGDTWLSACSNIDITDTFKPKRRAGFASFVMQEIGNIHSLFGEHRDCLAFVEGDALSIYDGAAVSRLRNVAQNAPTSFAMDHEGRIFHANGYEHGFILDQTARPWSPPTGWVGPAGATRSLTGPPGDIHLVANGGSRMLVATGRDLFYSEPFDPFRFVLDEGNIPFPHVVRMIRKVDGGFYVGTDKELFFLAGPDITEVNVIRIDAAPVIQGTDCPADASVLGIDNLSGMGVVVTTEDSILFLSANGQKLDLSDGIITYPSGATGTAIVIGGRYIVKINTFQ